LPKPTSKMQVSFVNKAPVYWVMVHFLDPSHTSLLSFTEVVNNHRVVRTFNPVNLLGNTFFSNLHFRLYRHFLVLNVVRSIIKEHLHCNKVKILS
jgi:hypothetical protein